MKRAITVLLAALLLFGMFTPALASDLPFTDVQTGAWFFPYVDFLHTNKVMQGTSETTFSPDATFTRAQVLATLFRIHHGRTASASDPRHNGFSDVDTVAWYAPYATWARNHAIVTGANLGANVNAQRQEIAQLIHRYVMSLTDFYSGSAATAEWDAFVDLEQIAPRAYNALRWANNNEIVRGVNVSGTMTIAPTDSATRAQVAAMLVRLILILPEQPPYQPESGTVVRQRIDWSFSIYREPDFRAERVASFGAQEVSIHHQRGDGWALIDTYRGRYWANLRENRRFIARRTGLHENRGDAVPRTVLSPQVVDILAQEGHWIQISTWLGPMWVNLNFTPPTQELDALLSRWGNRVSVYFANIETGFVYQHNPNRTYRSASVVKAPFSMYIYEKADRGETDLDQRIRCSFGGHRTQREMLRRNLMYSCNNGTLDLRAFHGIAGYRQWVAALGNNPNWVANLVMGSTINTAEIARFAWAIYHYTESDAPHAGEFQQHLLNNRHQFIVSDRYPIASKTGWLHAYLHDMAIVYADSPYILIVLSNGMGRAAFRDISMAFERFNNMWF